MKPDVGTNAETCELSVVVTSYVETSGLETRPDLSLENPSNLSMDTLNSEKDLSVTETNNNKIPGKAQGKDSNMYQTRQGQRIKETHETI